MLNVSRSNHCNLNALFDTICILNKTVLTVQKLNKKEHEIVFKNVRIRTPEINQQEAHGPGYPRPYTA